MKKIFFFLIVCLTFCLHATASDDDFNIKSGDIHILLQKGATAVIEVDYSNLELWGDKKNPSVPFKQWVREFAREKDIDDWHDKWPTEREECTKEFINEFNDENEKGLKIYNDGEDYKIILHVKYINFGQKKPTYGGGAAFGKQILFGAGKASASANGELEIINLKTGSQELLMDFQCSGGEHYTCIKRLNMALSDLAEELVNFATEYDENAKEAAEEAAKEAAKAAKKAAKEAAKAAKKANK